MSNTDKHFIVAKFDKVPFNVFGDSMKKNFPSYQWKNGQLEELYDKLLLPKRSKKNANSYDFFAPFKIELKPGTSIIIPTGIYVSMDSPWLIVSSPLLNTDITTTIMVEKIPDENAEEIQNDDEEYSPVDNSGHVLIKLEKPNIETKANILSSISLFGKDLRNWNKTNVFKEGSSICRAVLIPYGITLNDEWDEDPEHVDEIKIIEDFVWSEELYPGTTNPNLDGKSVRIMIIDDGNNITYKFSPSEMAEITDDDIDDVLNGGEITNDDITDILNS